MDYGSLINNLRNEKKVIEEKLRCASQALVTSEKTFAKLDEAKARINELELDLDCKDSEFAARMTADAAQVIKLKEKIGRLESELKTNKSKSAVTTELKEKIDIPENVLNTNNISAVTPELSGNVNNDILESDVVIHNSDNVYCDDEKVSKHQPELSKEDIKPESSYSVEEEKE